MNGDPASHVICDEPSLTVQCRLAVPLVCTAVFNTGPVIDGGSMEPKFTVQ